MGFKKWEIAQNNKEIAEKLAEECNIEPFLALMAYCRGYTDEFSLDEFLSRDVPDIDPFVFPDMEIGAQRVIKAIQAEEKILIYGDYDCDGVTSTALLYLFLNDMGANVSYYIPSRASEGYGMNSDSIKKIAQNGVKLIITVDNGIKANEEIELANSLGVDTVVTDHHLPGEELPKAVAVIDPHRNDSVMDFKDFAGVGVAFALTLAISGSSPESMLYKYSDLVALGTVADVMPLKHENRNIVWHGLRKINYRALTGLKALLGVAGAKFGEITAGTLAFTAAPRINAAGRMGDASRAVEMLIEKNHAKATEIAVQLDDENLARQKIEQEIYKSACDIIIENKLYDDRVIVVAGEGWHEGVLGIAAAKIAETFSKPTILLSRIGKDFPYKGSARTVGNFKIYDAIKSASEFLVKFGGHDKAAGLTLDADKLPSFCEKINEFADTLDLPISVINIDCRLNPVAVVPDLVYTLKPLEPYGTENAKPIFGLFGMKLKNIVSIGNGKHIRIIAEKNNTTIAMVMFGMRKEDFPFGENEILDFAVSIDIKEFQGQDQLSVFVKDVRPSGVNDDEVISQLLLYESFLKNRLDPEDAAILNFDRNELAIAYKSIKNGANTLTKLKYTAKELLEAKVYVMVDVMEELGLISTKYILNEKHIFLEDCGKVVLENSKILAGLKEKAANV